MLNKYNLRTGKILYDSPYYIFIKDESELSFLNLLRKYNIDYKLNIGEANPRLNQFEFYILPSDEWIVIMDNWWYSLYHLNKQYQFIDELGDDYEMFQFVVGDSDYSYEFKYHRKGKLVRHYEVSNSSYKKRELKTEIDYGQKLKGEAEYLNEEGEYEKVLNIAYKQGVKLHEDPTRIKSYLYSAAKINLE